MISEEFDSFSDELQIPGWHREELGRTEQRLAEGKEQILDWESAKRELRKAFELDGDFRNKSSDGQ